MTVCLTPGSPTPVFTLPNAERIPVSLPDHLSRATIVYLYPAAMTPGCATQAMDSTGVHAAFVVAGYIITDISSDTVEKLARFTASSKTGFPPLSDPEHEALNAYGALGTKKLHGKEIEGVLRFTSVIDMGTEGNGTIRTAQYSVGATGHVAKPCRELDV